MKKFLTGYLVPLVAVFVLAMAVRAVAATTFSGLVTLPAGTMIMPGAITQGQALRIGEAISNTFDPRVTGLVRPTGSMLYQQNGLVAYIKVPGTPSITSWEPISRGSFGGSTVTNILTARALQLTGASALTWSCHNQDWMESTPTALGYTVQIVASGATSLSLTGIGGRVLLTSGATANSRIDFFPNNEQLGVVTTNRWYNARRFAITSAVDANTQAVVGLQETSFGNGLFFGVCGGTSTAFYVFSRSGPGTPCAGTVNTTTVATTASVYHLFEMWGAADAAVHAAIDTVEISGSPFTTVLPTIPVNSRTDVQNGATAAARTLEEDYDFSCWSET